MNQHHNMKELSTTALAEKLNVTSQELFQRLSNLGLIVRSDKAWELTTSGRQKGGLYKDHEKWGKYIVWPESFLDELNNANIDVSQHLLTSTSIGKNFDISANKTNSILSELGLIERGLKGWMVTKLGKGMGGVQCEEKVSGAPYVRWSESIITNKIVVSSIKEMKGDVPSPVLSQTQNITPIGIEIRDKYPPTFKAMDGHFVRSKAEMLIDNWLYYVGLLHAYERELPVEENVISDFCIPNGKVYIEYWGYDNDSKYTSRKEEKLAIYKKHEFHLIQLTDKEVQNLDATLPRLLLHFGIRTE